ncbi:hypothetical protein HDV05_002930, partial [Chytridiales sp. JEL 0842]
FHDPSVFDPFDPLDSPPPRTDTPPSSNASDNLEALKSPDEYFISRQTQKQTDSKHIRDSDMEILLTHLGPMLQHVSFEGVLGLTSRSLDLVNKHCPNLKTFRVMFCFNEDSSEALLKLLESKRETLEDVSVLGLAGLSIFHGPHLIQTTMMPKLKRLRVDTDGFQLPFTNSDVLQAAKIDCAWASLRCLHLNRAHGDYEPGLLAPILNKLENVVDLWLSSGLDIVPASLPAVALKNLKKLRILNVVPNEPSSAETTTNQGLLDLAKTTESLQELQILLTPPAHDHSIHLPHTAHTHTHITPPPKTPQPSSISTTSLLALARSNSFTLRLLTIETTKPIFLPHLHPASLLSGLGKINMKSLNEIQIDGASTFPSAALQNLEGKLDSLLNLGLSCCAFEEGVEMDGHLGGFCPRLVRMRLAGCEGSRIWMGVGREGEGIWEVDEGFAGCEKIYYGDDEELDENEEDLEDEDDEETEEDEEDIDEVDI